ncbi:MAG: response regulator [Desulfamplus sp.]|nr:response regulator [Desulfamplus sp.]MBF0411888.1 response regulator [Desulfamplus sp.]
MFKNYFNNSIMIVDDKPANLKLLEKMLSEKGYLVRPFPKGMMALNAAFNDPPDLILLDINMPEIDGFEVCRRLKSDDRTKQVPIIFISALTETLDKIKAFEIGGVDYVTKPFQFEEVYARVKTHLNLKATQQMLEEKNQLLEKTLSDLKNTQNQLVQSEKMAALGVLTAGIAHEINNPVNFIKTSALGLEQDIKDIEQLLSFYKDNCITCRHNDAAVNEHLESLKKEIDFDLLISELPELMNNINEGVSRTQEIVSSLRLYSRMDDFDLKKIDIHSLIDAALVILKNRYNQKIDIKKEYNMMPEIYGQPGKLTQVFTNILANAIDALQNNSINRTESDKKRISINTSVQSRGNIDYIQIAINDNGYGIAPENLDKIFDPFFTTKDVGKGSGLGLAISIGIVREHNGMLEVDSSNESGTTFSVLLPTKEEK